MVAETRAANTAVATASRRPVRMSLHIFYGEVDVKRQALNVFRMESRASGERH